MSRFWSRLIPFSGLALFFGLWELYVRAAGIRPIVLPEPSGIALEVLQNPAFYLEHAAVTLGEALGGFALAFVVAVFVATAMSMSSSIERASWPVLIMVQSTPIIVFAPILATWFGLTYAPKAIMASLFVVIPLTSATFTGLRSTDRDTLEVLRSVDASRLEIFTHLQVPSALPSILSVAKVGVALALLGAIVAELYGGSIAGLGYVFNTSLSRALVYQAWGAVFCASILGIAATTVVVVLERRLISWHSSQQQG